MDSIPLVAFTGQVPTHLIGNDAFQEADNVGITPLRDQAQLPGQGRQGSGRDHQGSVLHRVHRTAGAGARGSAQGHPREGVALRVSDADVHLRSYNPTYEGHPGQIKKAARAIARAKRPVLYVGGGVISSDASPELMELAELTQIPLTQTLMGLGAFPMAHPLSLDMLGMHGAYYANMAVHNSDLLVAIGARFDDRVTGTRGRVRAERGDHPHRHRSLVDLQEHQGAHPDRRRLQAGAGEARGGGASRR